MQLLVNLALFACLYAASAHGGHEHDGPQPGENMAQYAQRHMASEHHIDSFDLPAFFKLHDLNQDGYWDKEEIEGVYGVHHPHAQKQSKDEEEHQKKADQVTEGVLSKLDLDGDGRVSLAELQQVGLDALADYSNLGAEGHHYDVESEFFLHHEEQYHSTPETQTDEAYNHPEDIEHFAHHDKIERIEAEREAKYQGVSVEEIIAQHEHHEHHDEPPAQQKQDEHAEVDESQVIVQSPHGDHLDAPPDLKEPPVSPPQKSSRVSAENEDPATRYARIKADLGDQDEWGKGTGGYKPPKSPTDKMRKNLPYKYKFRRAWGDF